MSIAEVAKATFYRHFKSKDALVLAYLENRDRALWDHLSQPTPPKDLREALTKFEQMVSSPEITGCPFLRIASEYPDPSHPFQQFAIQHQNKIVDYFADLLEPLRHRQKGGGRGNPGSRIALHLASGDAHEDAFQRRLQPLPPSSGRPHDRSDHERAESGTALQRFAHILS